MLDNTYYYFCIINSCDKSRIDPVFLNKLYKLCIIEIILRVPLKSWIQIKYEKILAKCFFLPRTSPSYISLLSRSLLKQNKSI